MFHMDSDAKGWISQLGDLLCFVKRSGALAPFLNLIGFSIVPFAFSLFTDKKLNEVELAAWFTILLIFLCAGTFGVGVFFAITNFEALLSEAHQKAMKKLDYDQKGSRPGSMAPNPAETSSPNMNAKEK